MVKDCIAWQGIVGVGERMGWKLKKEISQHNISNLLLAAVDLHFQQLMRLCA